MRADHNLRSSQIEVVVGGRNHLNLRQLMDRPGGAADPRDLASRFEKLQG
jgi:hypothetical protein